MLLEIAVADAYGAGFEYVDEMVDCCNDLSAYVQHPRHTSIVPGMYTDDTQMSLAIAELIVSGEEWTAENVADKFVEAYHRDPHEGYSRRTGSALRASKTGAMFIDVIDANSDKSGASMRAMPIGVFATPELVIERSTIQASVSHNSPLGIEAAYVSSLMTHYFLYKRGTIADLKAFLQQYTERKFWMMTMPETVRSKGWQSVRAAVQAVIENRRLSELLKSCINFKGDVDTVAAIALAAASCSEEYTHDLPTHLIENLENGKFGRDYIISLDQQLLSLVKADPAT